MRYEKIKNISSAHHFSVFLYRQLHFLQALIYHQHSPSRIIHLTFCCSKTFPGINLLVISLLMQVFVLKLYQDSKVSKNLIPTRHCKKICHVFWWDHVNELIVSYAFIYTASWYYFNILSYSIFKYPYYTNEFTVMHYGLFKRLLQNISGITKLKCLRTTYYNGIPSRHIDKQIQRKVYD